MSKKMHRKVKVFVNDQFAGFLEEVEYKKKYRFTYEDHYNGSPVSLTMPTSSQVYDYEGFPPFFDGLLPEGFMLNGLLRGLKIDRDDCMSQLIAVGQDMVGNVTVELCDD